MTLRLLLVLCLGIPALAQTTADSAKPANLPVADATAGAADPLVSAQALLKKGAYEDAAAAFKSIVEKNPTSAEAQAGLVRSLLRAHSLDEAEEAGKKAVAAISSSALVHAAFGDVNFRMGKFGEAEAEYRSALKLDPNSARGWFGMARMFDIRIESHDLPVFSLDGQSNGFRTEIAGFIGIRTLSQMKMTIDYRDGLVNFEVYELKKARE
jgi:tetratricopeptide (TPR) repeat protein